jgi:hypothetical protein
MSSVDSCRVPEVTFVKWWQAALVIVVVWCGLIIGGEYFLTGMDNDHQDELAGEICGFGVVIIPVGVFLMRKRGA